MVGGEEQAHDKIKGVYNGDMVVLVINNARKKSHI
jgi:hypothetical protein